VERFRGGVLCRISLFLSFVKMEEKLKGMQALHAQKTRALMRSISTLRKEVEALKAANKESRRTAMIQDLRKEIREHELVIDVLKGELRGSFAKTEEEMDEFIIKKTLGGPKRFRPKTREELTREIRQLRRELAKAKRLNPQSDSGAESKSNAEGENEGASEEGESKRVNEEEGSIDFEDQNLHRQKYAGSGPNIAEIPQLLERIDELQVELAAKERSTDTQTKVIKELQDQNRNLMRGKEKMERQIMKQKRLKDSIKAIEEENVELLHAKEVLREENLKLKDDLTRALSQVEHYEKLGARDRETQNETLKLLETIKSHKENEITNMDEIEGLKRQLTEVHQELSREKSQKLKFEKAKEELEALRQGGSTAEEKQQELQLSCSRLQEEVEFLRKEKSKAESEAASKLATMRSEMDAAERKIAELEIRFPESDCGDESFAVNRNAEDGDCKRKEMEEQKESFIIETNARKEVEERLKDLASSSEIRIRKMELSLEEMKKKLKEAQKDKKNLEAAKSRLTSEYKIRLKHILSDVSEGTLSSASIEDEVRRRDEFLNNKLFEIDADRLKQAKMVRKLRIALEKERHNTRILQHRISEITNQQIRLPKLTWKSEDEESSSSSSSPSSSSSSGGSSSDASEDDL